MSEARIKPKPLVDDITDAESVAWAIFTLFDKSKIEVQVSAITVYDTYTEYIVDFENPDDLRDVTPELYESLVTLLGTRNIVIKSPVEGTNNQLLIELIADAKEEPPSYFDAIVTMLNGDLLK